MKPSQLADLGMIALEHEANAIMNYLTNGISILSSYLKNSSHVHVDGLGL